MDPEARRKYEREYKRAYRAKHRTRLLKKQRVNRERNTPYNAKHGRRFRAPSQTKMAKLLRETYPARHLKYSYGLTLKQYEQMVKQQGGRCAICLRKRRLCVDHDHKGGNVRGLLCHRCNNSLGYLEEDAALFGRARAYIQKHAA